MPAFLRMEIFPSDMQRAVNFYTRVLRFTLLRQEDDYAYLQRDGIFLGVANGTHPADHPAVEAKYRLPPTGIEVVIEVDDLDAEREHIIKEGYPIYIDIKLQYWNLRDFRIVDPDGHYLRFTEHNERKDGKGI